MCALILISFVFSYRVDAADSPQYIETKSVGGTDNESLRMIEEDSQGNLYVSGIFASPSIDLNPGTGVDTFGHVGATSTFDVFLTKYNSDGSYAWSKVWGDISSDASYDIGIDAQDDVYLLIEFGNTIDFDPGVGVDNKTSAGSLDGAIIKINADGSYGGTRTFGSTDADRPHEVRFDSLGNMYIIGKFRLTVDFDPGVGVDNKTSAGNYDAFLTKFNADGSYAWTNIYGGVTGNAETLNGLGIDSSNNVYILGMFSNTIDFDHTVATDTRATVGATDVFLTRINADGSYGWTRTWGGTGTDFAFNLAVSPQDDIYTLGIFPLTVDFDPGVGTTSIVSAGSNDGFLSKFGSDGSYKLTYTWGSASGEDMYGLSMGTDGKYYVGGAVFAPIDLDPTSGTDTASPIGFRDQFFAIFDQNDNYLGSRFFGSPTVYVPDEYLEELYATNNKLYVASRGVGTIDFDPGVGVDNKTSAGGSDAYLVIYSLNYIPPVISLVNATPADTTAAITWTTDELSSSAVEYGLTSLYGSSTTETDLSPRVTSHSVLLSNLTPCTSYHYRVLSRDDGLNLATSTSQTFTTTGCVSPSNTVSADTTIGFPFGWRNGPLPPTGGFKVSINSNENLTQNSSVILTLSAGPDATRVDISNFSDFRDVVQQLYEPIKIWDICRGLVNCLPGEHTVYARFFTTWGPVSSDVVSDSIIYKSFSEKVLDTTLLKVVFNTNLGLGDVSPDIKQLQMFLNSTGFTVANIGPGSKGKETTKFGFATKAALAKYQKSKGILPINGYLGPKTRAAINLQLNQNTLPNVF